MFKLPFWAHPDSWKLNKGTYSYTKAKIEYEMPEDSYERALALLNNDLDYNRLAASNHEVAKLELDFKYNKNGMDKRHYEKALANLKGEPYFNDNARYIEQENGVGTVIFDLDWNEHFVAHLREQGYDAPSAEQTVDMWFTDLCKQISGDDEFIEDFGTRRPTWGKHTKKSRGLDGEIEFS